MDIERVPVKDRSVRVRLTTEQRDKLFKLACLTGVDRSMSNGLRYLLNRLPDSEAELQRLFSEREVKHGA